MALQLTTKLNQLDYRDPKVREILSDLFGKEIDQTILLLPPFYTYFGLDTKIGKNAVMAAGSVVTKDVAPNTIVGGNPAKYMKTIPL